MLLDLILVFITFMTNLEVIPLGLSIKPMHEISMKHEVPFLNL